MTGSAPGADARRCVGPDCEGCRGPLPGTTCGKGKDWRARAEAAEAEVERLREWQASVRCAWRDFAAAPDDEGSQWAYYDLLREAVERDA